QSAREGDIGGVYGHAAVGMAQAASPLIGEGIARATGAAVGSPAVVKGAKIGVETAKFGAKVADIATFERLGKLYKAAKAAAGNIEEIKNPAPKNSGAPFPENPGQKTLGQLNPPLRYPGAPYPEEQPPVYSGANLPVNPGPRTLQQLNPPV